MHALLILTVLVCLLDVSLAADCNYEDVVQCDIYDDGNLLLENPSDYNGRIELTCYEETRSIDAVFKPARAEQLGLSSAFHMNCTNGTHFEISHDPSISFCLSNPGATFPNFETYNVPESLAGSIFCTVVGCYAREVVDKEDYVNYRLNSTGQNCYFPDATEPTESVTTAHTISSTKTVLISATTLPSQSLVSSSFTHAKTFNSAAASLSASMTTALPEQRSVSQSIHPTSTMLASDQDLRMDLSMPLTMLIIVIGTFFVGMLTICTIGILCFKKKRRNKFVFNLRTGYGLQAQDNQAYKYIEETMLAMPQLLPTAPSILTICDSLNYSSLESDRTESLRGALDDSDVGSELETVILAALVQYQDNDQTESLQDEYIPSCNYLSTGPLQSLGYLSSGQEQERSVQNTSGYSLTTPQYVRPLAAHFSDPSLLPKHNRDYIIALTYTSQEAIAESNLLSALEDPQNDSHHYTHTTNSSITRSFSIPDNMSTSKNYVYM